MPLQKKDFIEIEFTARTKDGEVFDSNIKSDLEKVNPNIEAKPFVFCIGEGMFLKGVEDFLIGKEIGKYQIELSPENAFGKRDLQLIKMIPMKVFREQKLNPVQGAMFNFDNRIAKILSVSGGRVVVDFNNPIAGKEVVYDINILRKIDNTNEKISSFVNFLFRQELNFEVKEKKLVLEVEKAMNQFARMFKDKFKEIFDLELEVKEIIKKE